MSADDTRNASDRFSAARSDMVDGDASGPVDVACEVGTDSDPVIEAVLRGVDAE